MFLLFVAEKGRKGEFNSENHPFYESMQELSLLIKIPCCLTGIM
ncbi:hypothetical protein RintRC_2977 [Richelia intracellularis]|nr:hypothetical protein RintRC_2977 [Richelia intracellularis]